MFHGLYSTRSLTFRSTVKRITSFFTLIFVGASEFPDFIVLVDLDSSLLLVLSLEGFLLHQLDMVTEHRLERSYNKCISGKS